MTKNSERRLAAIMFADVVGYSRMMGEDEAGTLAAVQQVQFGLINPTIGQHYGRVVKQMGDGVLVEFNSIVHAVQCAVAIQQGIAENRAKDSGERIKLRIGVNLGDVLSDGDDIFGDGINIASRLQELADPNGICIPSTVLGHIDGLFDHGFVDAGAHQFKNISKAVRVYQYNVEPGDGVQEKAFRPFIDLPVDDKPVAARGCLCGQVRYEVTGKALGSMLCH